ncbi:MAG: hypothetical protein ACKO5E_06355, partial [bacterium]
VALSGLIGIYRLVSQSVAVGWLGSHRWCSSQKSEGPNQLAQGSALGIMKNKNHWIKSPGRGESRMARAG